MERTYVIPLRKAFMKTPSYNRTNRAVREVQIFLKHHMKTENVKLGEELNKALWARGDSKPPARVTVLCKKEDDVVYAELAGTDFAKKDFSEEALKAAADAKPKKAPAKADAKKDAKTKKAAVAPLDDSGVADPAELIGKAATAKAKAEGKVKSQSLGIEEIEGVGPAYAEKLAAEGVSTTEALLHTAATKKGRSALAEKTGISEDLILTWTNHADLIRLSGVGGEYAELLEAAGVDTVPELATRRADNLTAKMAEVNAEKKLVRKLPTEKQVTEWIAQAKTLSKTVSH